MSKQPRSSCVRRLDKLFADILNEFASRRVSEDNALLSDLVDETRKYLFGRELLPILDRRRKAIRKAAGDTGKEAKEFPAFSTWAINGHTHEVVGAAA